MIWHNIVWDMIKLWDMTSETYVTLNMHIHYHVNWLWSVFDQVVEGGSSLTSIVQAHVSFLLTTDRGISTETCGADDLFPPNELWFGSEIDTNCAVVYNLHLDVWLMGCVIECSCLAYGERGGQWWRVLSGHWLSCTGFWHHLLYLTCLMHGLLFLHLSA